MGIIEKMRLDGKKIFVTGGAQGIGKCVATAFCEAGADVAIVDINFEKAQVTANELIQCFGCDSIAISCDVTNPNDVNKMIDIFLDKYGQLNAAFCNAGIALNVEAEKMTYEQWKKVIDVNLSGIFLTDQAAGKIMLKQGHGSIINTASMSAHIVNIPQPQCSYNASKAGVIQLTKSLAIEWAAKGVRVNSISPGYMATDLIVNNDFLKPMLSKWAEMSPMKRLGYPEELESICVYLAGDTSTFTTGADFVIDGAYTCF